MDTKKRPRCLLSWSPSGPDREGLREPQRVAGMYEGIFGHQEDPKEYIKIFRRTMPRIW